MLNIFFCYSVFWSIILLLYSFQWSDLLVQLNINILIFIIFTILMSALTGYLLRDKIKIQKKISETHKSSFTLLLVVFFVLDLLYAGKIPLVYYLENISYHEVNFEGIPIFHNLINSLGIFYSFHLSYLCVCYKKKKYYMENFLIISFYIILLQRQNIFICIIVFLNVWLIFNKEKIKIGIKKLILAILFFCLILYCFGYIGNTRYGYKNYSSSMITTLGKQNDKYPIWIPNEYFWTYIYLTSPLANLNYNVNNYLPSFNLKDYTLEFVPDFIRLRLPNYEKIEPNLQVSSLNVSTQFLKPYLTMGFFGVYIIYLMQLFIYILIIYINDRSKSKYSVAIYNCLLYSYLLSFFDNTFTYSITALLILYSLLASLNLKIKIK